MLHLDDGIVGWLMSFDLKRVRVAWRSVVKSMWLTVLICSRIDRTVSKLSRLRIVSILVLRIEIFKKSKKRCVKIRYTCKFFFRFSYWFLEHSLKISEREVRNRWWIANFTKISFFLCTLLKFSTFLLATLIFQLYSNLW